MEFLNIIITYLTALDYAKENGNDDIAELISGYPYSLIKLHSDKSIQLKNEIGQLRDENDHFKDENKKLKDENNRLKEMASKYESIKTKKKESTVNEFKTLTEEEVENLIRDKEISSDIGAKIIKVFMKEAYALKEMSIERPKAKDMQHFIHEYEIMILLDHVNILKALGIFLSATKPPCILFESCHISLLNGIKNRAFSNKQLILIIYQIAEGMRYVHSKKIIHSNLNPENILITTDGTVKIAGFGFSRLKTDDNTDASIDEEIPYSFYKAPEIIKGDALYDEKVDVFAFGFLVFFILNQGNYPKITPSEILEGKRPEIPPSFTNLSKNLIDTCLKFNPKDRPDFKRILDFLENNRFDLLKLNKVDTKNVLLFVKQHKEKSLSVNDAAENVSSKLPPLH